MRAPRSAPHPMSRVPRKGPIGLDKLLAAIPQARKKPNRHVDRRSPEPGSVNQSTPDGDPCHEGGGKYAAENATDPEAPSTECVPDHRPKRAAGSAQEAGKDEKARSIHGP